MSPRLTHLGLYVWDLEGMTRFYELTFGLCVTDRGRGSAFPHDLVFLSADASEHHQLVLVSGRPRDAAFSTVMQVSFKVGSLQEVRDVIARAVANGATGTFALSHGNAWSGYGRDPEGNTIEVYTDTPWHVPQPCGVPLDLDQTDEEIYSHTEAACRSTPGSMTRAEWQKEMAAALGALG